MADVRMGEPGQLTGVKDKRGREIRIGDTLQFNPEVWNKTARLRYEYSGEPQPDAATTFVIGYEHGELQSLGTVRDLSEHCIVVLGWDE